MPTGYTADVQSGKVTDFSEFAMQCARSSGALGMMRGEPSGAEIPETFKPSTYNAERLVEARAQLAKINAMTTDQREAAARSEYEAACVRQERYEAEQREQRARYQAMIDKVTAWTPPTPDHVGMKDFMLTQLAESIDFDCRPIFDRRPTMKKRDEWFSEAVSTAERDIEYHTKEHAKEVERAASRTAWIAALRQSLKTV